MIKLSKRVVAGISAALLLVFFSFTALGTGTSSSS